MLELTPTTKVYILAPAYAATGGIELSHQLADYLRNKGKESYIVYFDGAQICQAPITPEYKGYNIVTTTLIEDSADNILIVPETSTLFMRRYQNIRMGLWWMSVDNYLKVSVCVDRTNIRYTRNGFLGVLSKCYRLRWRVKDIRDVNYSLRELRANSERFVNLYQSTYIKHFLLNEGLYKILPLSDYINADFTSSSTSSTPAKEDIILYSPKRGLAFTKRVIASLPEYKFIALKGMSRTELTEWMQRAKLYLDFGNHPGKDRLPRETAMNGCCIMTSLKGSAQYFEDVAIPSAYKFKDSPSQLGKIRLQIIKVMSNYEEANRDFDMHRRRISAEKGIFYQEIDRLFDID